MSLNELLQVKHNFSSGVYAKQMSFPAGQTIGTHKHTFDHLSILASGTVWVEVDGVANKFTAPACITIKADAEHRITAMTDAVWFCIHATNETDADNIDATLINS